MGKARKDGKAHAEESKESSVLLKMDGHVEISNDVRNKKKKETSCGNCLRCAATSILIFALLILTSAIDTTSDDAATVPMSLAAQTLLASANHSAQVESAESSVAARFARMSPPPPMLSVVAGTSFGTPLPSAAPSISVGALSAEVPPAGAAATTPPTAAAKTGGTGGTGAGTGPPPPHLLLTPVPSRLPPPSHPPPYLQTGTLTQPSTTPPLPSPLPALPPPSPTTALPPPSPTPALPPPSPSQPPPSNPEPSSPLSPSSPSSVKKRSAMQPYPSHAPLCLSRLRAVGVLARDEGAYGMEPSISLIDVAYESTCTGTAVSARRNVDTCVCLRAQAPQTRSSGCTRDRATSRPCRRPTLHWIPRPPLGRHRYASRARHVKMRAHALTFAMITCAPRLRPTPCSGLPWLALVTLVGRLRFYFLALRQRVVVACGCATAIYQPCASLQPTQLKNS